jgi:hypothetical protein
MSDWPTLDAELDRWARADRIATLWWRDDDAVTVTPALDRLMQTARQPDGAPVPLCLAVIPAEADGVLAKRAAASPQLSILQHGFSHRNHAPPAEKKQELGTHRPPAVVLGELTEGRMRLRQLFAGHFLPVLVPPWNRIAAAVRDGLAGIGMTHISTYGPRTSGDRLSINTHVDIIDWHGGRGFVGEAAALRLLTGHLSARREQNVDPAEPTGILTHHLVQDEACWEFLTGLVYRMSRRPEVRWVAGTGIFGQTEPVAPERLILS